MQHINLKHPTITLRTIPANLFWWKSPFLNFYAARPLTNFNFFLKPLLGRNDCARQLGFAAH
jgi:hypothetical protein